MIYEKLHICSQCNYSPELRKKASSNLTLLTQTFQKPSLILKIFPSRSSSSVRAWTCSKNEKVVFTEFLLKSLQLVFFLKVSFSKFSEKLFNRAPVDGCCLCIQNTCKTLNITSKISKEVHFLGKCEHFTSTDHLHSRYLRTRFR